jgi:hypothetical protein
MNLSCDVIQDLLPLYAEGIASKASDALVEEHLKTCEACRKKYKSMKAKVTVMPDSTLPLKKIQKKMRRKRYAAVFLAVAMALVVAVTMFSYISSPEYFPYSENLLNVNKLDDGTILVSFNDKVTGYRVNRYRDDKGHNNVDVQAWRTTLDQWMNKGLQTVRIAADADAIYYCTAGEENKIIYGQEDGAVTTLPRLVLGYYVILAAICSAFIGVAWIFLCKRRDWREVIEKVFYLPVSYIIGHICVKGFTTISYSSTRDFCLILLTAFAVYCVIFFAAYLVKQLYRKD